MVHGIYICIFKRTEPNIPKQNSLLVTHQQSFIHLGQRMRGLVLDLIKDMNLEMQSSENSVEDIVDAGSAF